MTASTDSTTRREVVVDTALADIWERQSTASRYLGMALDHLHYTLGERPATGRSMQKWPTSGEEAKAQAVAFADDEANPSWKRREVRDALASVEKYRAEIVALRAEAEPYEDEYEAKRWSRFFLVKASNGHIHSSMHCSTCYPTTVFGWLPDLSGLTEADAVAAHGPLLCSVCFPSAPVEWTVGKEKPAGCAGSGKAPVEGSTKPRWNGYYGRCSVCGEGQMVTQAGVIRKHKPKA